MTPKNGTHIPEIMRSGNNGLPLMYLPSGSASARTPMNLNVMNRAISASVNPWRVIYSGRMFMKVALMSCMKNSDAMAFLTGLSIRR